MVLQVQVFLEAGAAARAVCAQLHLLYFQQLIIRLQSEPEAAAARAVVQVRKDHREVLQFSIHLRQPAAVAAVAGEMPILQTRDPAGQVVDKAV